MAEEILSGRPTRELRQLRLELRVHHLIRRAIHGFDQSDYVRLFDLLDDSTSRSLSECSRDEVAKFAWQLFLAQPRLFMLLLRGLAHASKAATNGERSALLRELSR